MLAFMSGCLITIVVAWVADYVEERNSEEARARGVPLPDLRGSAWTIGYPQSFRSH